MVEEADLAVVPSLAQERFFSPADDESRARAEERWYFDRLEVTGSMGSF